MVLVVVELLLFTESGRSKEYMKRGSRKFRDINALSELKKNVNYPFLVSAGYQVQTITMLPKPFEHFIDLKLNNQSD